MPNEVCSKCHEDFMNCKCEQFHPNVILNSDIFDTIYFITSATDEEIAKGEYYSFGDIKISSNPKKLAVIRNVKR